MLTASLPSVWPRASTRYHVSDKVPGLAVYVRCEVWVMR